MSIALSVANQVALITGGSRGIGAACVRMFAEAGAKVVFSYQRRPAAAQQVVQACGPDCCFAVQADLGGLDGARELVAAAVERFGRLDLLVVNHGIWPSQDRPVDELPDEQWRQAIGVDLDSVFALVKHAVKHMKKQSPVAASQLPAHPEHSALAISQAGHARPGSEKREPNTTKGRIVLVSSTSGQRGEAFHCDYAAAKGALISMTKGLAVELAPHGIYVNCVAPGWVNTDMAAPALNHPQIRERVLRTIPLRRVGTPEEIAVPILFLCTGHAGFITGEIFNVNGGAVLAG